MFSFQLSCFSHDPADVGNLISCSSAFSKTSLNIWKFTVHILLKPDLENFEHYFASTWDECNCAVEGNGNPLQCSCLENPRDRGAWWAAVYGVTQSRTQLKWLNSNSSMKILWHCLSLGLEWKLTFSSPVATAEFSKFAGILSAALSQHHLSGSEMAQLEIHHLQ